MTAPFSYLHHARSGTALVVVGAVWVALLAAQVWLDASVWIVVFLGAFTLPAVFDLIRNPASGLDLDSRSLRWHSGRRTASVDLSEIDHVRLDTRLDFSVRATLVLATGRKLRLPFESTPPHRAFEDALTAHGIKVQRHHFQLLQ